MDLRSTKLLKVLNILVYFLTVHTMNTFLKSSSEFYQPSQCNRRFYWQVVCPGEDTTQVHMTAGYRVQMGKQLVYLTL